MNVGELFVNLGIKGSEKTVGALTSVKTQLGEAKSMSLEMKAAIVGAIYAFERMFRASGMMGTGLTNFNALTGLSARQLQQWQYAARQAGVANEEFTGSLKAVQNSMTNMLLGKGAPEGLAMVANKVGFDARKARDTFYVMEQLQKFAKTAPADMGNAVLKSFGLGEGTIAAMRRNAFNPAAFAKAPTYSQGEIKNLDQANIAWSNLGNKVEMAFGRFNAKHGQQLVRDISKVTDSVIRLAEALTVLGEKMKVFDAVSWFFDQLAGSASEFTGWLEGKRSFWGEELDEKGKVKGERSATGKTFGNFFDMIGSVGGRKDTGQGDVFQKKINESVRGIKPIWDSSHRTSSRAIAPKAPTMQKAGNQQNVNINQNLNFQHEGKDAKQTADSVKKANQDAYRQFSQGQAS